MSEFAAQLDDLKAQIRALFPIGSEWYDCGQDHTGTVVMHFPPRGIILRQGGRILHLMKNGVRLAESEWEPNRNLVCYDYGQLLRGQLIQPRTGGWYHQYRDEQQRITDEYYNALYCMGLTEDRIWSDG